jgi:hypothetical protein
MTKKIKIITILSSSVMAASAFGVTTGILLSNNHDSKPHKPTIKMENVYSIRDYLLKRYAKVLTNAGDTQEYIDCQVAKVQNDVDSIITDGISGNFSVDQIYSSIYAYGGRINITVYDWVMLDKFIKDSLKTLKQSLIASGLPIAKVNYIYNHYSTMVINEEGKCKQSASSPNEIIEHMKTFGKEMATEAMEEDYEQLAQYQIDNFATSEKIQLVNNLSYYYDNLKRDAETQTDIVPSLTRVLEYDGLGIQSDIINTIINKDGLKSLADKKSNYQLMGKIENFDDSKNLVKIIFSIKDLIHNDKHGDPIVKKASKPFQFYLPFSPTKEVANTANEMKKHHFDFVKDVTFAD